MKNKIGSVQYKYLYAQADYGDEEKAAVMESLENPWLAAGPKVQEFENEVTSLFGHNYGVATNSGSSANLLALESLDLPQGSEVITPACTFSTVVSSILQNNLVPVFIDSLVGRYTINEKLVEQAITPRTKAIMAPHLIGGVVDLIKLREVANAYNLYLVDDSCDTLGIRINGQPTGFYSDVSTTSFYGSHIITACGFGGMVSVSDRNLYRRLTTFKDWGRVGGDGDNFEERFNYEIDGIPYDGKFLYSEFGYNLKMNESAAAFGLEQLKKLPSFISKRQTVFNKLYIFFSNYSDYFILPELLPNTETSWLAFPLTIKGKRFTRKQFLSYLEHRGIQTRVLFSGNITRHPAYRRSPDNFKIASDLDQADIIMEKSFLLGAHQQVTDNQLDLLFESVKDFANEYLDFL
jgi:CDP-6-deoxy-D-xylo-4-hexulose-3-dehydrase